MFSRIWLKGVLNFQVKFFNFVVCLLQFAGGFDPHAFGYCDGICSRRRAF